MADYEGSAASQPIAGASRSIEEVTAAELMAAPTSSSRPEWMVTRYPVSMDEFARLNEAARIPDPVAFGTTPDAIEDKGYDTEHVELPEDDTAIHALAPTQTATFDGIPQTAWQPPDCTIATGPNQVLVAVNSDLAGYTKAGAQIFRWANMALLFSPVLPAGAQIFDPRVAYDHYTGRWIVVTGARRNSPAGSWLMLGVSQGANPAGPYWIWALDASLNGSTSTNNWADYPMLGFDTQAIYISSNMFQVGGGFQYPKLRILNKAELYAGGVGPTHAIRWFDFWGLRNPDNSVAFTVQPAVHFRGVGGNPAAYLANGKFGQGSSLTLWTLTNPIGMWTGGAAGLAASAVACQTYDLPPDAEQPGTTVRIANNDDRLLNAIYQNAGGVQRLWTAQTSKFTWPGDSAARSVVAFYEIDVVSKTVVQQNRFGASGLYYFFPAIQTDVQRRAFIAFGRSGANEFGSLRQTGRRVGDPPNTLQGSALVQAGQSAYTGGRWGDYFGICRDGGDPNTVWMYGESAGAGNTWRTRVAAVMLPAPTTPTTTAFPTSEMEALKQTLLNTIQQVRQEAKPKTTK